MSAYPTSRNRARLLAGCAIAAAATATQAPAQRAFQATPTDTIGATVNQGTGLDVVTVNSTQALIDWTPVDNAVSGGTINILAAGDELRFRADDASSLPRYTVLNRINPADPSRAVKIDGIVNSQVETGYGVSDGSIWFYTPGGIILGPTARFDVGSLVLTTNPIQIGNLDNEGLFVGQDTSAFAGTIAFRGSADSKSFVTVEAGAKINASGSYVALVAPRVAQRGAITVNGSAALIAAESADVTIPVSGNLFEIAVFSGSKVDTSGETIFEHKGSTEITDPAQTSSSRRVYMIAVPKNDAITMLVSGKAGYEAASAVTASSGRIYLYAETNAKITADNPRGDGGFSTNVLVKDLTTNTNAFAGGTFVSLDATAASSSIGGALQLSSGASSAITVANGFSVDVGNTIGGSVQMGVAPSTVSVSSGGSLKVAGDLSLFSFIGTDIGSDMSVIVDNGTIETGGDLGIRSYGGDIGGPASGSTGGATSLTIRNNGLITVGGQVALESRGLGIDTGGIGAQGTGGAATLAIETGGKLVANSLKLESFGEGGSSFGFDGKGGLGKAGTTTLSVSGGGELAVNGLIELTSIGQGGAETGYGSSGSGTGGTIALTADTGGIITAATLIADAGGVAPSGERGAGSGTGGTIDIDLKGGSKFRADSIALNLAGVGGTAGSGANAAGGSGTGGALTFDTVGSTLTFDALQINAQGQGGSGFSFVGGDGTGGKVALTLTSATLPGANSIVIDTSASGGEGGGSAAGGRITLSVAQTSLTTGSNIDLLAKGFGDFGNDGGGSGTGGKIAVTADNATVVAANVNVDASGSGEAAFSSGSGGDGQGGTIDLTSTNGGLLKGLSFVTANGLAGDGDGPASAGAATGGTITIRATGGTIDSVGGTLRVSAEGVGGIAETGGSPQLARGGTIDIDVSGTGQLALSALEASTDAYFSDSGDGIRLNDGGRGVGGTARIMVSGGSFTASAVTLSAGGKGAVSPDNGVGGAGYQGRAEMQVSGGTATVDTLAVNAVATGGEGYFQDSEIDARAGGGGAAGIGVSPFAGQAGAVIALTGGSFTVGSATVDGGSIGGDGGDGEFFTALPQPREGGSAVGGFASFSSSGTASFAIDSLVVRSEGEGGAGGALFLGEGSVSNALAGDGGNGTGGLASITIGGTGSAQIFAASAFSFGTGGDGGTICSFFCGAVSGTGRGGDGGAGAGGGANIVLNRAVSGSPFLTADSQARGGSGGFGPRGGDGGDALAGSSTIAVAEGDSFIGSIQVLSDGLGGLGADGSAGNAGSGGSGAGFNATLTVGADAKIEAGQIALSASGQGGQGGRGGDDVSTAFGGGDGGDAAGGKAAITVNGGTLVLEGGSERPPASLTAFAAAGDGGQGGTATEGTAGTGGDGGDAAGGEAVITSTGGAIDLFFTAMSANATGGGRGQPGGGIEGVVGDVGFAEGGTVTIKADQSATPANRVQLGFGSLSANAAARFEELAEVNAGNIVIDVKGGNPAGALTFSGIEAEALGFQPSSKVADGIRISGDGSPISVIGAVNLDATGSIRMALAGDSGLRATGDVAFDTSSSIVIDHLGQAPGGAAASLSGREVRLDASDNVIAAATSRIETTNELFVSSLLGSVQIGSGSIGRSVLIEAAGDVTVAAGARLIADESVDVRSGDDIIIGTGALLRAANDPPAESGYGGTDPRERQTQLRLYAGSMERAFEPGNVASLILKGNIEAPARTIQLEAGAIQADEATAIAGGDLFVRMISVPDGSPSDDFGQLSAPCLEGSVCLGDVNVGGIIRIGERFSEPQNLRLNGGIDAADVVLLASDTVRLGRAAVASTIKASDSLIIEATTGDLLTLGTVAVTGPAGGVQILVGDDILAGGLDVTTAGSLTIGSGGNVVLGTLDAGQIRTIGEESSIINPNGITATGLIGLAGVTTGTDLLLDGASITVDRLNVAGAVTLTARAGTVTVTTDAVSGGGITATGESVSLAGLTGLDITLASAGQGNVTLTSGGGIDFANLSAANTLNVTAIGKVTGGAAAAGQAANFEAVGGIALDSLAVSGPASLLSDSGGIVVAAASASDLTAKGSSVDVTGVDGLSATIAATAGDVKVATLAGALSVGGSATGAFQAVSAAEMTTRGVTAGGALSLSAKGDISGGADLIGSTVSVSTPGRFGQILLVRSTAGQIGIVADNGIRAGGFISAGKIDLRASNGAITTDTTSIIGTGVTAIGKSVTLVNTGSLAVDRAEASAGTVSLASLTGSIDVGLVRASDGISLNAESGSITVADAASTIQSALAKSIALASSTDLTVSSVFATDGDLSLSAPSGAVTFQTLSATKAMSIAAAKDVTGGSAKAGSISIQTPGAIVADDLTATAGALTAIANQGVSLDTAVSTGTTTLKTAQGVVKVAFDIQAGDGLILSAPSIELTAQKGLNIVQAITSAGDLKLNAVAGNLTAGTLASAGGITLTAQAGRIDVTNDLSASGPIQATAQAMSLTTVNDLVIAAAQATGGDIVLASKAGAITLGQATAAGALTANTPGLLSVNGAASGATIAFTSKDIAIGNGAQLGSKTATTALTLISTADRLFIGDATGTGYRLDTAELGRIASKADISLISAPQNAAGAAFTLVDPAATNVVVGALTFDGAQLGPNGTLRITSPRSIGFTGNSQFKNFGSGQTVTIAASADISLAAETGMVTLKDSAGGLAGTLRLEAGQVHAMSTKTRTDVAGLTLNDARQRLGTNDQVDNQGGYFQAGAIVVRMNRLLIQNSGQNGTDPSLQRGLTANSLTIFAGEGQPAEIVLSGRVNGVSGAGLRDAITVNGGINPGSTFNGCAIGDASCGVAPPPEPSFDPTPVISAARDQIEDDEEEDEKEEALQASQTRPEPIIQFMTPPSSRFDPLIDEPVTGAGNEDFWEPTVPTPGQ